MKPSIVDYFLAARRGNLGNGYAEVQAALVETLLLSNTQSAYEESLIHLTYIYHTYYFPIQNISRRNFKLCHLKLNYLKLEHTFFSRFQFQELITLRIKFQAMANGEVADADKPLQKSPRLGTATRVSGSLASVLVREITLKLETRWRVLCSPDQSPSSHVYSILQLIKLPSSHLSLLTHSLLASMFERG